MIDTMDSNDCSTTDDKYYYSIQITESLITNSSTMNGVNGIERQTECKCECDENDSVLCSAIGGNGDMAGMGYGPVIDNHNHQMVVHCASQPSYKPSFNSRQMHNQKERMRRSRMKSSCEALRTMVPGVNDKTDKATVLEQTVNFLVHLSSCSGVNCTDYIPEIPPSLSSKSMQCYQQYVPSKPIIDYGQQMEHHLKLMENDENDGTLMNGESRYQMKIIDCGDCGQTIINQSTARLVTTNDGKQFMVIDTNDNNDNNDQSIIHTT